MKTKTLKLDLPNLTEKKLVQMLDDHEADIATLYAILEALFDMWSSALRFSSCVVTYGERKDPDFLETFTREAAERHGVNPDKMLNLIKAIRSRRPASTLLH